MKEIIETTIDSRLVKLQFNSKILNSIFYHEHNLRVLPAKYVINLAWYPEKTGYDMHDEPTYQWIKWKRSRRMNNEFYMYILLASTTSNNVRATLAKDTLLLRLDVREIRLPHPPLWYVGENSLINFLNIPYPITRELEDDWPILADYIEDMRDSDGDTKRKEQATYALNALRNVLTPKGNLV
jgi:hypothetical protein